MASLMELILTQQGGQQGGHRRGGEDDNVYGLDCACVSLFSRQYFSDGQKFQWPQGLYREMQLTAYVSYKYPPGNINKNSRFITILKYNVIS